MLDDDELLQIKALMVGLLEAYGLTRVSVLKNAAAAERMRRYRAKRNASVTENVTHSPTKRNETRNGSVTVMAPERNSEAIEVLEFLNAETHHKFPPVKSNLKIIVDRLKEGYTVVQLRQIVVRKNREWGSDPKMKPYLRPKTVFNATNTANYAGDLVAPE